MKRMIFALVITALISCEKEYTCKITTSDGTTTTEGYTTFTGTPDEKEEFEQSAMNAGNISQTIDCN